MMTSGLGGTSFPTAVACAHARPRCASRSMHGVNREIDGEDRAFARRALDPDGATVRMHELAGDPQPKTEPAILPDLDGPLEPAEDPLLVLARDADAFVLHGEERAIAIALDPDVHRLPAAEFERVEEQVGDDMLEAGRVPPAHHWRSEERRVGKECRSRWAPDH